MPEKPALQYIFACTEIFLNPFRRQGISGNESTDKWKNSYFKHPEISGQLMAPHSSDTIIITNKESMG
jgi:hypothetical protein